MQSISINQLSFTIAGQRILEQIRLSDPLRDSATSRVYKIYVDNQTEVLLEDMNILIGKARYKNPLMFCSFPLCSHLFAEAHCAKV